jgi:hypothetical protein
MKLRGSGFRVLGVWWFVALVVAGGLLTIALGHVRLGGQIMCGGFVVGAFLRLVARPARKAGGLTVRSRWLDVVVLLSLGIGLLIASATVNLNPQDPERLPVNRTSR